MSSGAIPLTYSPGGSLISLERESQVFWSLRARLVIGSLRRMMRMSRLRATLVLSLSILFWWALFFLFYSGFDLLAVVQEQIIEPLYNAFFASLMVMLIFSSAVIMYSSLYRSPEAALLLTMPARTERIFAYLFHEAIWFGSWGFLLIGSPMLVASGMVRHAPWYYYAMLAPFMTSFVFIPAAVGGILCLLAVDRLGRIRRVAIRLGVVLGTIAVVWLAWSILSGARSDLMTPRWFQELSERLRFAENRWLPSWWLSTGLLEASHRPLAGAADDHSWSQSVLFLVLLISNALFFHQVAMWLAARVYRSSFSRMQSEQTSRRRTSLSRFDRWLVGRGPKPPSPVRLLLLKELRLFRRDPVQWSQCLIFFALLALYFVNIRRFSYNPSYSAMIGFLNLAVIGLILSTFTTRFIFPMVSLEGQRFWMLAMLPVSRDVILWTKFAFAATASLIPCCALMLLSDLMLDIRLEILLAHQLSCAMLCLGLSAIAVGLGARLPDLHERSPSKIAAGFGGTLTLVVSAIYIVAVVMLTAVPYHFRVVLERTPTDSFLSRMLPIIGHPLASRLGLLLTVVLGTIAIVWPLHVGLKSFRRLDP